MHAPTRTAAARQQPAVPLPCCTADTGLVASPPFYPLAPSPLSFGSCACVAGKTTLVNYILREQHGKKICVIENEFGAVNIDEALVKVRLVRRYGGGGHYGRSAGVWIRKEGWRGARVGGVAGGSIEALVKARLGLQGGLG